MVKYPFIFYVKGSENHISRSISASIDFETAIKSTFPHLFDQSSGSLLPKYANLKAKIAGFEIPDKMIIKYLYEAFKNIDGFLYITLVI